MQRYFLVFLGYAIFIVLFHICNYFVWKKARGKRAAAAYLRIGRSYFFLFLFFFILPGTSVFRRFFHVFAWCLTGGYVLEFLLRRYFMKSCRKFRQSLRPDSKIIILEMYSMRVPWKLWRKWADLMMILLSEIFMNIPPVVQKDDYVIVREVIAYAFRRDIEAYRSYLYIFPSRDDPFSGRESVFWKQDIELYLVGIKEGRNILRENLPFPADRIRFLMKNDAASFPLCLIPIIEDGGMHESAEERLSAYAGYQGGDPGKACLARMIGLLLEKRHSAAEYFYELMKLAEFMIHYQSLADYEISGSCYFDVDKPVAMGTFESGIADVGPSELKEREAYIKAVKYLNQICTGREGSVNRRKLPAEGRRKLVMVRNHFIGHGSLSYGISTDFVRNLLTVVSGQADVFFRREGPAPVHTCIHGLPKLYERENGLYLLIQIEKNFAGYYLDHASGKYFTNILQWSNYGRL